MTTHEPKYYRDLLNKILLEQNIPVPNKDQLQRAQISRMLRQKQLPQWLLNLEWRDEGEFVFIDFEFNFKYRTPRSWQHMDDDSYGHELFDKHENIFTEFRITLGNQFRTHNGNGEYEYPKPVELENINNGDQIPALRKQMTAQLGVDFGPVTLLNWWDNDQILVDVPAFRDELTKFIEIAGGIENLLQIVKEAQSILSQK